MASVALKDVLFTIPIHESHQKYFKFEWINKVYRFAEMPNGYSVAMQIFTKILKSVYVSLRQKGHLSVVFVDDLYLQRNTETEFLGNVEVATAPLKYLGFSKICPDANKTNWVFGFHNWLNQNYCHN